MSSTDFSEDLSRSNLPIELIAKLMTAAQRQTLPIEDDLTPDFLIVSPLEDIHDVAVTAGSVDSENEEHAELLNELPYFMRVPESPNPYDLIHNTVGNGFSFPSIGKKHAGLISASGDTNITVNHHPTLDMDADSFAVAFWIKKTTNGKYGIITKKEQLLNTIHYEFQNTSQVATWEVRKKVNDASWTQLMKGTGNERTFWNSLTSTYHDGYSMTEDHDTFTSISGMTSGSGFYEFKRKYYTSSSIGVGFEIYLDGDTINVLISDGTNQVVLSITDGTINDGEFHSIIVNVSNTLEIFVDGISKGTISRGSVENINNSENVILFARNYSGTITDKLDGNIAWFVWKKEIFAPSQIADYHSNQILDLRNVEVITIPGLSNENPQPNCTPGLFSAGN